MHNATATPGLPTSSPRPSPSADFVLCLANNTSPYSLVPCPPSSSGAPTGDRAPNSAPQPSSTRGLGVYMLGRGPPLPTVRPPPGPDRYLFTPGRPHPPRARRPPAAGLPHQAPPTSAATTRSYVDLHGTSLAGVLPTSILHRQSCSTPPVPRPTPWSRTLPLSFETPVGSTLDDQPDQEPLQMLSITCGGAVGKMGNLLARLSFIDAVVICLHETASLLLDAFQGTPYSV